MNKRLPIAVHELKEWQKGQRELGEDLKDKPAGYVGARVAKRLTTDCYARGVCRGAVECANLTTAANDPTAAESIKTATVHPISLRFGFQLLDAAAAGEAWPAEPQHLRTDSRPRLLPTVHPISLRFGFQLLDAAAAGEAWPAQPQHLRTDSRPRARQGRVVSCPFWTLYGARGRAAQVYELCAFEFARHFRFQQAKRPFTLAPMDELDGGVYHAALTDAGAAKLGRSARANLQPALDYEILEEGGEDWLPLGHGALAQKFRHDWVLTPGTGGRGNRARDAQREGCLGGRFGRQAPRPGGPGRARRPLRGGLRKERLAALLPVDNPPRRRPAAVPYLGDLCKFGKTDWRRALRRRLVLRGFPTEEVKLFALNFCFVYCLPRELRPPALAGKQRQRGSGRARVLRRGGLGSGSSHARPRRGQAGLGRFGRERGGGQRRQGRGLCVMTKQMFDLSRAAWKTRGASGTASSPGLRAQAGRAQPGGEELDHDALAQAARASRSKSRLPLLPGIGVAPRDPEAQPLGPRVTAARLAWQRARPERPERQAVGAAAGGGGKGSG